MAPTSTISATSFSRSKEHSSHPGICRGDATEGGNRTSSREDLRLKDFSGLEEGDYQKAHDIGPVYPEQVHCSAILSDDDGEPSKGDRIVGVMDGYHRPQRRLLAYPHSSKIQELSSFFSGAEHLPLQGHAIRPQYSSENLHEDSRSYDQATETRRDKGVRLSRRLVHLGAVKECMPESSLLCPKSLEGKRLHHQHQEVSLDPHSVHRVVGSCMGVSIRAPRTYSRIPRQSAQEARGVSKAENDFEERARINARDIELCLRGRSRRQSTQQTSVLRLKEEIPGLGPRRADSCFSGTPQGSSLLERPSQLRPDCAMERASAYSRNSNRRLGLWMGLPYKSGAAELRNVAFEFKEGSHQRKRAGGDLLRSSRSSAEQGSVGKGPLRQHLSSGLHYQQGLHTLSTPVEVVPSDSSLGSQEGVLSSSCPHSRSLECARGCPLQSNSNQHGVDSGQRVVRSDSDSTSRSAGRSFCHQEQQSASVVRISSPGFSHTPCGRVSSGLEPVGENLSLSSHSHDFSGFGEDDRLQGRGHLGHLLVSQLPLVPDSSEASRSGSPTAPSPADPEGSEPGSEDLMSALLGLSRLDFLSKVYTQKYGQDVAAALNQQHRFSTGHQYEVGWSAFKRYILFKGISALSPRVVLEFLTHLFNANSLLPRTINQYKCSLALPLQWGFGIDLSLPPFSMLSKAFLQMRPVQPRPEPNWSLDKVLYLIRSPAFSVNPSLPNLCMKTLFLLGLATGQRVSELQALRRGRGFLMFKTVGTKQFLLLVPDPAFLAKNECPVRRRKPIKIQALLKANGSHDELCPVNAVRQYLRATRRYRSDKLFFNPRTGAPCTKARISQLIRRIVKISQPDVYSRAHDLRAYACAKAFYGLLTCAKIRSRGCWNSNLTFIKHYLPIHFKSLTRCVALGEPVSATNAGILL